MFWLKILVLVTTNMAENSTTVSLKISNSDLNCGHWLDSLLNWNSNTVLLHKSGEM